MSGLRPAKNPVLREAFPVFHDLVAVLVFLIVDKIRNEKVDRLFPLFLFFRGGSLPSLHGTEAAQHIQNTSVGRRSYLVVTVHHLEINAGSMAQTLIDSLSVTAVFLMNSLDNGGIFRLIAVCNGCGFVL